MNLTEYKRIRAAVIAAGHISDIEWSESVKSPESAEVFAREFIFVVCNSGMKNTVAVPIFQKIWAALKKCHGFKLVLRSVSAEFGHKGKVAAICDMWINKEAYFKAFNNASDKLAYLERLQWIGPITKYHLAKNFGVDCAKPDRHLERIAAHYGKTVHDLCFSISHVHGDRIATVDVVLWRAAAIGIIKTKEL